MIEITIVIVNYNTEYYVKECINSILNNYIANNIEIIIIDNSSPNNNIGEELSDFKNIKIIFSEKNVGFGAGCNLGAKYASGDYLLLLNPDIKITKDSIEHLIDIIENDQKIGVCSGVLTDENQEIQYSYNYFPDLRWEFKEATSIGLKAGIKKLIKKIEISKDEVIPIDWAHGAVLMIKRSLFEEIGGFDEDYFLYYEDVDLQKRLADIRKTNYLVVGSKFYHHERSSIDPDKPRIVYFHNMHYHKLLYYKKHHKAYKRIILRLLFIISYCLRIFLLPFTVKSFKEYKNKFLEFKTVLNVYFCKVN